MQCISINQDGTLTAIAQTCDYVLITHAELQQIQQNGLANTLNELFAFDLATFGFINAMLLVSFIIGHSAGRVVRLLGKT